MAPERMVAGFVLTPHAAAQIRRRGIGLDVIAGVLEAAEQKIPLRAGRIAYQARLSLGRAGKVYLVRVIVDVRRHPAEVVTAYRTSRVDRYWSSGS